MIGYCLNCGKLLKFSPSDNRKYCSISCQLKYEYKTGIRNKYDTGIKARKVSHNKQKNHNWLNDKSSRDKLKNIMNTEEFKLKCRNAKLGVKNPMYGKYGILNPSYKGGSIRKYGSSDRGFNWKFIRSKIKQRDNYTCQECGIKEQDYYQNLQVHHKIPYKCTQDNSEDNLITLCSKCHAKLEPKFYKVNKIEHINKPKTVYNLSVKDDETYIANDLVAHNCRSEAIYIPAKK
jgi:5-methylcytosine-specific restriction endonuclease McrA